MIEFARKESDNILQKAEKSAQSLGQYLPAQDYLAPRGSILRLIQRTDRVPVP